MAKDLRSYLAQVEQAGYLLRVRKEVDPPTQMGELCATSLRPVLFENLTGYPGWRACDILARTRETQAIILGCEPKQVVPTLAQRIADGPVPARVVSTGPCKEIIWTGEDANINHLPIAIHSEKDAGRYIGGALSITKDPETGIRNVAMLRCQVRNGRRSGILFAPRHSYRHLKMYEAQNRPMPFAMAIGVHPALEIASNYCGPYGLDELELGARLLGEELELVKCETIDLEVPAHSEVVIEGNILPNVREDEGPFGEFQDYYSGGVGRNPVFEVTAITMRRDPIYRHCQATIWTDHQTLAGLPREAGVYLRVKETHGGVIVHDVYNAPWGGSFTIIMQITPQHEGQVTGVLMAAMSTSFSEPKVVIAVDEDVDIFDARDVMWAIGTRTDPASDFLIVPNTRGHVLDVAAKKVGDPDMHLRVSSKVGIDATKPPTCRPEERADFERARAMGYGKVRLADFVDVPLEVGEAGPRQVIAAGD